MSIDAATFELRMVSSLFGGLLQATREHRGQSIQQAARRAGMDPDQWRAIEAGEQVALRAEMPLLARGLGMTEADLVPLIILSWGIFP